MSTEQMADDASKFRVVLATSRPIIGCWFAEVASRHSTPLDVTPLPLSSSAVAAERELVSTAKVAVVDASIDLTEALEVCREVHACQTAPPIAAVFCCPESATPAGLRALCVERVRSFMSLEISAEETLRLLRSLARGQDVISIELGEASTAALLDRSEGETSRLSDDDIGILRLVALGLTDHEIGQRMFLSPHTVKHRIERLRRRVNARNRIQLAAWAGRLEAVYMGGAKPAPNA